MACLHARLAHGPGKNQTQNVIGSRKCPEGFPGRGFELASTPQAARLPKCFGERVKTKVLTTNDAAAI